MRNTFSALSVVGSALFGAVFVGCDRPPAASPAGGPSPTTSPEISIDRTTDEPGIHIDAPGAKIDVGGDRLNDGVDDSGEIEVEGRRRLRLPNVDIDVNRTPGGAPDVDVNVDR